MKMKAQRERDNSIADTRKNILRRLAQVLFSIILIAVILLAGSGKIDWFYAWAYIAASLLVIIINAFIFPRELISERGRKKENVEKWDKVISGLISLPWVALYLIAGLDFRWVWSPPFGIWVHIAGMIIFLVGNALVTWAMLSNTYFSTAVRIQYDRGHTVSSSGPYGFIRHPGYLGMIIYLLASPLLLGSVWALIPAGLSAVLFTIRTVFEDNTLKNKLKGYKEYAERVKYRLIPGIW
jgi:protein-S-isoprenylcysteine O-methyltransferase Ste14